jgi:hypothetical protein
MTKPAITKRIAKGSALTYEEQDTNFQNLADATVTLQAGTGGTNVVSDLNGVITLVAGTNITLAGNNTAKSLTINSTGGEVFDDKSPQLGADLDVNGFLIKSNVGGSSITLDANLTLTAPGGYSVYIDGWKWPEALPDAAGGFLKTDTSGVISVELPDRLTSNNTALVFSADSNGPNGILNVNRNLQITTTNGGQGSNISLVPGGSGDIQLTPGTGKVTISAVNFPTGDGTNGQTLITNGTGQLSWGPGGIPTVTTTSGRDSSDGYSDNTRPRGYTIYNSDTKTLQYWSGWSGSNQGYNWQDIGNYRSFNPTTVTVDNAAITSQSANVPYLSHGITYITWTATTFGYIELPNQISQIGKRYTLCINKSGSAAIGFRDQGTYISGEQIGAGETGEFIYDIEFLGSGFGATVIRR